MNSSKKTFALSLSAYFFMACGGASQQPPEYPNHAGENTAATTEAARVAPPASGPVRDVHLPPITRYTTTQGLEVNIVRQGTLPVAYARLAIRSGLADDPQNLPGLSRFIAEMLKQGTRAKNANQLAEAIEFLGADLSAWAGTTDSGLQIRSLSSQLDQAITLLAEVATQPSFAQNEINKAKRRELDRLRLDSENPSQLARRVFYRVAFGESPLSHVDATPQSIEAMTRRNLSEWHAAHFVPNNAVLVVVGNVDEAAVRTAVDRAFRNWRGHEVTHNALTAPTPENDGTIHLVHRPNSVQSIIAIGNIAVPRNDPNYIALTVANQVLGGGAASRLFQDLRERRSLTYGAYSSVDDLPVSPPFRARAAVMTEKTAEAFAGFLEHLNAIRDVAVPDEELNLAKQYLADSFPLEIDTAARVASMVSLLRIQNLPDDYWDRYRSEIRSTTSAQALTAAHSYIQSTAAIRVVVGDAERIAESLRAFGNVVVENLEGREIQRLERTPAAAN